MLFTREVLLDERAPAYALLAVMLKTYGADVLHLEPELLRLQIEQDFDLKLPDIQSDKIQAAFIVMTTEQFEQDWRVFETCCHLFHNEPADHDMLNPLDAEDIAAGLSTAALIKNDIEGDVSFDFHDDVLAYAGRIFYDYGLAKAPKILPNAIVPNGAGGDDVDKNEALNELFDAHAEYSLNYVDKLQ